MPEVRKMREGFVQGDEPEPVDEGVKKLEAPATEEADAEVVPFEAPADEWPLTIKLLHKPLQIKKGEEIKELTFREPTAGDLMRAGGNPCRVEVIDVGGGMVTWQPIIDDMKMIRLMASLCGVHEPVLQRMDTRDYSSCSHKLRKFFLPEQGIW
jgi:hypothetical protein